MNFLKKVILTVVTISIVASLSLTLAGCPPAPPVEEVEETTPEETTEEVTEEVEKPLSEMVVGYIMPYNLGWFAYLGDAFDLVCNQYGIKTIRLLSWWEAEKEIQAVQDLVAIGVDAINVCSGGPDAAQRDCQIANEANIPISIEDSAIAEGPGKPITDIEFDWYLAGQMMAEKAIEHGGTKVVSIQGIAGVGPVELQNQGLMDVAESTGKLEVVKIEYCEYMEDLAYTAIKDIVQSGLEFDVVIGGCMELTEGVIEGLKSENVDLDDVFIMSCNGGPMDVVNFDEGELDGAISQSPGFHGLLCALTVVEYLKGNPPPELVFTPIIWVDQSNYKEKTLPWHMDTTWIPIAEEFIRTGELEY